VVNTVVDDGENMSEVQVVRVEVAKPEPKGVRTGLLRVNARQYTKAKGIRWERAAGFLAWAAHKYGAQHVLTVPEWIEVHEQFNRTPVGR